MRYTFEQLVDRVKDYFKDDNVNEMIATEDGQVFHSDRKGKSFADAHAKASKLKKPFSIKREHTEVKTSSKEDDKDLRKELFKEAKELGLDVAKNIPTDKLQAKINEEIEK